MSAIYSIPSDSASVFDPAEATFAAIKARIGSEAWAAKTHDEIEVLLEADGRELLRRLYQAFITLSGQRLPPVSVDGADGIERTHSRHRSRTFSSIFGKVELVRCGVSARGAASLFPVDAALNLPPESFSMSMRRRAAERAALNSFDETTRTLRQATGTVVAKRQVEELVERAATDFDAFYEQREPLDAQQSSELLVVSLDMKGVVVRTEDLREKTRQAARTKKPKLDTRRSVGERRNRKRMAAVAAVYTLARWQRVAEDVMAGLRGLPIEAGARPRPKPEQKRVWASVVCDGEAVVEHAFQEALRRDPQRAKHWVVLVDGDRNQLCWIRRAAQRHGLKPTILLDIIHVIEYLWIAAHAFHDPYTKRAEAWVAERLRKVLEGKAGWVAGGMRRSAKLRGLTAERVKRVNKCANYLKKYSCYLRYDRALRDGLPIATGVIEGACRYLIGDRLDITGARWSLEGAEAVLRLRALRASEDFEAYWAFHTRQEYERNHAVLYAAGEHPELRTPHRQPHLRLVSGASS